MSAENRNFTSMNTEIQLQLANIRIAQLLDELSELRKHSGASHEAELREQYSRERESDRAFYRDQLACMEERHKQELEALKESYQEHAEELKRNYKESNAQLKRQLQSMSAQISTLQNSLNASSLSEAELKALDRFHRSQRFKRSSEQTRLLKNKKEVSRSQEKDDFDGDGLSQSA